MSEPNRYILVEISGIQWMHVKENRMTAAYPGEFVRWDDYARLKAEVERLRKAGDAMADEIVACYRAEGFDPKDSETLPKWNAAKEGKPSV